MLVFLDTEFTGLDQARPDLISIGLVDETGREFYTELPETDWTVQCNEWVNQNVVPHLWGGDFVQSVDQIRNRLRHWIESTSEDVMMVSDSPGIDFLTHLKWLLPQWPKNLEAMPVMLSVLSMGEAH